MANFLNRLAARAVGIAHVAQPVVPAMFSPDSALERSGPPLEAVVERLPNPTESRVSSLSAKEAIPPKQGAISRSSTVPPYEADESESPSLSSYESRSSHHESWPLAERRTPATEHEASSPAPHPLPHAQPAEHMEYVPNQVSPALIPAQGEWSRRYQSSTTTPVALEIPHGRRQHPSAAFSLGPLAPSNRRTLSSRRDQTSTSAQEAPVVRVTIGRVDVHAHFPPPAPSPAATRQVRPPALSLEQYLKERSEGKR